MGELFAELKQRLQKRQQWGKLWQLSRASKPSVLCRLNIIAPSSPTDWWPPESLAKLTTTGCIKNELDWKLDSK